MIPPNDSELPIDDPLTLRAVLQPFLDGDLLAWQGLPRFSVATLNAALGEPVGEETVQLGWYPARCNRYVTQDPSGGLLAFVRNRQVVLIEAVNPPPIAVLEVRGEPSAILPHQIVVKDAYV